MSTDQPQAGFCMEYVVVYTGATGRRSSSVSSSAEACCHRSTFRSYPYLRILGYGISNHGRKNISLSGKAQVDKRDIPEGSMQRRR